MNTASDGGGGVEIAPEMQCILKIT